MRDNCNKELEDLIEDARRKIAEREAKEKARESSLFLFGLEYPTRYRKGEYFGSDNEFDRKDVDQYYMDQIEEAKKIADTNAEKSQDIYTAIFNGLKRMMRRRMNFVDAVVLGVRLFDKGNPTLRLYKSSPEVYIKGFETMEYLSQKYNVSRFKKDMELFSRLVIKRFRKDCDEALPLAKWLKERGCASSF